MFGSDKTNADPTQAPPETTTDKPNEAPAGDGAAPAEPEPEKKEGE